VRQLPALVPESLIAASKHVLYPEGLLWIQPFWSADALLQSSIEAPTRAPRSTTAALMHRLSMLTSFLPQTIRRRSGRKGSLAAEADVPAVRGLRAIAMAFS
jgi:hypothetical protein